VTSGRFLNGGGAAIAACTDTTIHLLVAQEGSLDGEGQLDVVCEQPLFATSRTVARLPGTVADEQVRPHCKRHCSVSRRATAQQDRPPYCRAELPSPMRCRPRCA
jgi:hypothetical protein